MRGVCAFSTKTVSDLPKKLQKCGNNAEKRLKTEEKYAIIFWYYYII